MVLYDVHYHLFDLSHPNLLSFISRTDLATPQSVKGVVKALPLPLKMLPMGLAGWFPGVVSEKIRSYLADDTGKLRNLLSVMEGAIEYHFLYNEYYLLEEKRYFGQHQGTKFNKLAICPLLMDFGYKDLDNLNCFYHLPPAKPIVNQVVDLFNAIWFYYNYDIKVHPEKEGLLNVVPTTTRRQDKLFEIYPFLGINTRNYRLNEIKMLFDKYFDGYDKDTSTERKQRILEKSGTIKFDVEEIVFGNKDSFEHDYYSYLFAGIKLYPPLGFNPWPEEDKEEMAKVRYLYEECTRRRLPVTVHCSDGGFVASSRAREFTDPRLGWSKVLSEYPGLKINFAHSGSQGSRGSEWRQALMKKMSVNKNIFADCSCGTPGKDDYKKVSEFFKNKLGDNYLFGTDFVINLLWSGSYNEYLNNFIDTEYLTEEQKITMGVTNPVKFLFG